MAFGSKGDLPLKATIRVFWLCIFYALPTMVWGYGISTLAIVYVHPGFKKALNDPPPSHKGVITAIYYLGTWTSYVFISARVSDKFGRRAATAIGVIINCIGASLLASARNPGGLAMMIIGRIICGIGLAMVSTTVPLYQSEMTPARSRGKYICINHAGLIVGMATAFWVGYALDHWETAQGVYYGWRLAVCLQYIPAFLFLAGAYWTPETPRWLIQQGRNQEAVDTLSYLRALDASHDIVSVEIDQIKEDIRQRNLATSQGWTVLFTSKPLFERLWRVALLHFMAQMCGNTSMKYYLPDIFMALGMSRRISLMISGIETTMKIACTLIEAMIVDRLGRRITLVAACVMMTFALMINGALPQAYPDNSNRVADYACVVFIFLYTFAYSIGFGSGAWVYGAEIFPTNFRARGLNIAASGGPIGSIISSQTWPVGMDTIGSRTHFIFMCTNLVSAFIIWFFYPETKRRSLEDMEVLFNPEQRQQVVADQAVATKQPDRVSESEDGLEERRVSQ